MNCCRKTRESLDLIVRDRIICSSTTKQGHQTTRRCEGALRRGWGWRSVAERVPRSPSADAFVARSVAIIFHSRRINESRWPPSRAALRCVASRRVLHIAGLFLFLAYTYARMYARTIHGSSVPVIILLTLDAPVIARRRGARDRSIARARTRTIFFTWLQHSRSVVSSRPRSVETRHYARVCACNISLQCKRAGCKWRSDAFEHADIEGRRVERDPRS